MKLDLPTATRALGAALLALGMTATTATPSKAGPEPFIGELTLYPYMFCPRGWAEADGSLLPISQYTALFSLLGTNYGGDGRTTFGLPKKEAEGTSRWCIALEGVYPSRS